MSGVNNKMSLMEFSYARNLPDNIKKLKMISETILQFDEDTSMSKLEMHEKLLQIYWQNCVSGHFEAGKDIPFDDSIFWWQSNGESRYLVARDRLSLLVTCYKMCILVKSHKFTSLNRVTHQIYYFDISTPPTVLETFAELLEEYWLKFSDSYSAIVSGIMEPSIVANLYSEKETYYINAKLKLKHLLHYHSKVSIMSKNTENQNEPTKSCLQKFRSTFNSFIFERICSPWLKIRKFFIHWFRLRRKSKILKSDEGNQNVSIIEK